MAENVILVPPGPFVGLMERFVINGPVLPASIVDATHAPLVHPLPRVPVHTYPPSAHFMVVRPDEPYVPLQ